MSNKGMLHIYMGDGKGKTTASAGLALRCAGQGGRVVFAQFMKNNDSGELEAFQDVEGVLLMPMPFSHGFVWDMSDAQKADLKEAYAVHLESLCIRLLQMPVDMLVMDEILAAIEVGFVDESIITDLLDQLPESTEVVLTGRNPSRALIERADYVTEMKKIKHPFDNGAQARKGIEY